MKTKMNPFEYFQKPIPQLFWQILIISPAILLLTGLLDINYLHFIGAVMVLEFHRVQLPKIINKLKYYKEKISQFLNRINPVNIFGELKRKRQEKAKNEETIRAYEKARREEMNRQDEMAREKERIRREEERTRAERARQDEERIRQENNREEAARKQREWDNKQQERTRKQKTGNKKPRQEHPKWWEGKDEISLKREWKRLAKIYHPDSGTSPNAEMMKRINAEYDSAKMGI